MRSLGLLVSVSLAAGCISQPQNGAGARHDGGRSAAAQVDASHDPCESLTAQQRAMVVARVGTTSLTLCDFAQRMNLQNQYLRARFAAPEQRRALLRNWVDSEILAAEARARGLDRDPHVEHAITSQLARQLETQIRSGVHAADVTDAEVSQYFTDHHAEYDTPEQARADHIVLATREDAQRVLADARAHPNDDAHWRELARRESIDRVTKETGGDLGFFSTGGSATVAAEVATATFALHNPGDLSDVVESAHGGPGGIHAFHIVRLVAHRDALHRTLAEVRTAIRNRLWRERFDTAQQAAVRTVVDQLRSQAHVTIDEASLAQVHLEVLPPDGGTADAAMVGPGVGRPH